MSMLRKLKQQVTQAVSGATSSEHQNQHQSDTSGGGYVQIGQDQQGFLCPVCMTTFATPDQLQNHFSNAHTEPAAPVDQTDSPGLPDFGSEAERNSRSSSISDDNLTTLTNGAFTCPQCFAQLPNAETLQRHFREQHELSETRIDGDTLSMQLEIKDLRSAVQEEKWYSSELKKELALLQSHIQAKGADMSANGSDEPAYLMQQIHMLEAGKAMVTQQMLEFDKECGALKRANEGLQREKERVLEKSAHMAKEVVMLKSQIDEEYSQKQMLGEDMIRVKAIVDSLEKQLDQRPSEDDVNVLRKELVHAQTLMDTITQEKENEIAQLSVKLNEMNLKHEEAQKMIKVQKEQLSKAPKSEDMHKLESSVKETSALLEEKLSQKSAEAEAFKQQIAALKSELSDAHEEQQSHKIEVMRLRSVDEQHVASIRNDLNSVEQQLAERDERIKELKSELDAKMAEVTGKQEECNDARSDNDHLKIQVSTLSEEITSLKKELTSGIAAVSVDLSNQQQTFEQTLAAKQQENDTIRSENESYKKNLWQLTEEIETLKKESAARLATLEDLTSRNEDLQTQLNAKVVELEQTQASNFEVEHRLQDIQRQLDKRSAALQEKEVRETELVAQVASLEQGAKDMLSKIEEGHGTQTAIAQLSSEKQSLVSQLTELNQKLTALKQEGEAESDRMHDEIRQKSTELSALSSEKEKVVQKVEQLNKDVAKAKERSDRFESELKTKSERLVSVEKEKEVQRTELEAHLQELRQSAADRKTKLIELSKENDLLSAELDAKKQELLTSGVALNEERKNLQVAIQKLEAAQKKAEERAQELEEAARIRQELEQSGQKLDQSLIDAADRIAHLESELALVNEQFAQKEKLFAAEKESAVASLNDAQQAIESLRSSSEVETKKATDLVSGLQQRVNELEAERQRLVDSLNSQGDAAHKDAAALKELADSLSGQLALKEEALTNQRTENEQLVERLRSSRGEGESLGAQIASLEANMADLQSQHNHLKDERNGLQKAFEQKAAESDRQNALIHELEMNLAVATESATKQSQETTAELSATREELQAKAQEIEQLNFALVEAKQNLVAQSEKIAKQEEEVSFISSRVENLSADLQKRESDMSERDRTFEELMASKLNLENQLSDKLKQLNVAEASTVERETKWKKQEAALEREKAALLDQIRKSDDSAVQARQEAQRYQEAAKTLKGEYAEQIKALETALDGEMKLRESEKNVNEEKVLAVQAQVESLTENLADLRSQLSESRDEFYALNQEKSKLEVDSSGFEAQTKSWQDERRALLERCLNTESDLEFERERALENKRRFDDALAAMHELGRANQSLQIDMSKQFNRKWLDDSEAVNCTSCGKQFTLTVRKHHCRNCGLIFCNECSSKTTQVASSKRPVRVCEACHTDLASR